MLRMVEADHGRIIGNARQSRRDRGRPYAMRGRLRPEVLQPAIETTGAATAMRRDTGCRIEKEQAHDAREFQLCWAEGIKIVQHGFCFRLGGIIGGSRKHKRTTVAFGGRSGCRYGRSNPQSWRQYIGIAVIEPDRNAEVMPAA